MTINGAAEGGENGPPPAWKPVMVSGGKVPGDAAARPTTRPAGAQPQVPSIALHIDAPAAMNRLAFPLVVFGDGLGGDLHRTQAGEILCGKLEILVVRGKEQGCARAQDLHHGGQENGMVPGDVEVALPGPVGGHWRYACQN